MVQVGQAKAVRQEALGRGTGAPAPDPSNDALALRHMALVCLHFGAALVYLHLLRWLALPLNEATLSSLKLMQQKLMGMRRSESVRHLLVWEHACVKHSP